MSFFKSMGRSVRPKGNSPRSGIPDEYAGTQDAANTGIVGQPVGKPLYLCNPFVRSTLIKGNYKTIVVLPKYVDRREWVAVNRMYIEF